MSEGYLTLPQNDPLTGAYSRALLDRALDEAVTSSTRAGTSFSILLLDLDHFKSVNDAFGHRRGDEVLVEFTRRLLALAGRNDMVFRYGGDEFVFLLPETSKSQAAGFANSLLEQIFANPLPGAPDLTLSLSIGVSTFPDDGLTANELFESADFRHYQAKRYGRNRVVQSGEGISPTFLFSEVPALLESDSNLRRLESFLDGLPTIHTGLFAIRGAPGAGKSRLLTEAAVLARHRGYAVLTLSGSPARLYALYGALNTAFSQFPSLSDPLSGESACLLSLNEWLLDQRAAGLLVLLDHPECIDPLSLDFLHTWPAAQPNRPIGFITAIEPDQALPLTGIPVETLDLVPLTGDGIKQWLSISLDWVDPHPTVIEWIQSQSGGMPGNVVSSLDYLLSHNLLLNTPDGWTVHPALSVPAIYPIPARSALPRFRLPENPGDFIGRQQELARLRTLLEEHNLVIISGPGGVGKTRLAIQAGLEFFSLAPDGVFFVPLDAVSDPEVFSAVAADALELRFFGTQPLSWQLRDYLKNKNVILILDNLESPELFAALIADLTAAAPGLRLLVTTRSRPALGSGAILELGGLPYPAHTDLSETISPSERLFLHLVRRRSPGYNPTPEEREILAHLCRLLEGMPLALELAAAWVPVYSLAEILNEMEKNIAFLVKNHQEDSEQHRRLTAVFDSFWGLLSVEEQHVLSRLSVFHRSFTAEAAGQVASASLFFLDALASRSYLRKIGSDHFELHELLRRYSAEKLAALEASYEQTRQRHARYFLELLFTRRYDFASGALSLPHAQLERENFRLAWNWAVERTWLEGLELGVDGMYAYCHLSCLYKEGEQAFAAAIDRLLPLVTSPSASPEAQILHCRLLFRRAGMLNKLGLFEFAGELASSAILLAHNLGELSLEASASLELGESLLYRSDYPAARQHLTTALNLARKIGAIFLEIDSLYALGGVCHYLSDQDGLRQCAALALELSITHKDLRGQARAYNLLAIAADMSGEYSRAIEYYNLSIQLSHTTGDLRGESIPLVNLASLYQLLGNYAGARHLYEQYLQFKRVLSDRAGVIWGMVYLSLLFHQLGNDRAADVYARQALNLAEELGDRNNQASAHCMLGHALASQGEKITAAQAYRRTIALRLELGQPGLTMDARAGLARLAFIDQELLAAIQIVDEILAYLEGNTLDGADEPFRIWLTCYRVLAALHDSRARTVLAQAIQALYDRAGMIQDEDLRRTFLQNVSAHRELLDAWSAYSA